MTMAQDDAVNVAEILLDDLRVVKEGFPIHPGVEDHLPRISLGVHELQQQGEPPLTDAPSEGIVLCESGDL